VSNQFETKRDAVESGLAQAAQESDTEPPAMLNPPKLPRKRKGIFDITKPLESPEDEAIAQYLATPKSIREFKSFAELAAHFKISRMTVYRQTKDLAVLQRAEWLLTHHRLAGDLVARLHWERIVAGQVRAAIAGDTKAAQFCKEQAWPEVKDEGPFGFPFK
jgi:hypothetical protein